MQTAEDLDTLIRDTWVKFRRACFDLSGDAVLVPFRYGEADWEVTDRDTLVKVNHWTDLEPGDVDRLAILTDGFSRWLNTADDISVVTLWRQGTPEVVQIDGPPSEEAVDLMVDALTGNVSLDEIEAEREGRLLAANDNESFDDVFERLRDRYPHASEKVLERRARREIDERKPPAGPLKIPQEAVDDILERLPTICPADWAGKPVPDRQWFLPDLIPARNVSLLTGDGGTGKSLLAMQIGIASALGVSTAGLRPAPGKVLYLAAEDDADELHRRTVDIVTALGGDLADLAGRMLITPMADKDATLAAPGRDGVLQFTRLHAALEHLVKTFEPGFVILDTAADLFAGDEIKRNQVRTFIAALRKLALKADCAVLLLAHPSVSGIQSGTGTSGSTGWSNSVRSRLYLTRPVGDGEDPAARELTVMKSNYAVVGEKVRVRWEAGAFVADSPLEPAMLGVVHKLHDEAFVELLSKMTRHGQTVSPNPSPSYAPKAFSQHPDGKGVTKAQFQAAMHRLLEAGTIKIIEEGSPSRRYKRLYVTAEIFGGEAA